MKKKKAKKSVRNLVMVLGDQLNLDSEAFDGFDPSMDAVWMAEVGEEATHVWSHKARIALFLSAMRHFRDALREKGFPVRYRTLDDPGNRGSLAAELAQCLSATKPERLIMVNPGEFRAGEAIRRRVRRLGTEIDVRPDRHFLFSRQAFADYAATRKQLRMEFFYREVRKRTGILMTRTGKPAGGKWNYDADNRQSFGPSGPGKVPEPIAFAPSPVTQEVLQLVSRRFPEHPGSLEHFDWPVTPDQARRALDDFLANRLGRFGPYQDAMWTGMPFGYHSRLSPALNLKLLSPQAALTQVVKAYEGGTAPIGSVEGFVRQVLGWREYVRGIYWLNMPGLAKKNALEASVHLPGFYWSGETDMGCLRQVILQTLAHGYAHHIQRLMVTGLFALMLGVIPREVHEWYLAVYVDAVEWVELPNTLCMSQFSDGGILASKPYVATGKYIKRMSNYCNRCRYKPGDLTGDKACPFTTLYWDFLIRHETLLGRIPRMGLQLRNLKRLPTDRRKRVRRRADELRNSLS
jgi:deoxyribodipyrimidine photolyase-related protein